MTFDPGQPQNTNTLSGTANTGYPQQPIVVNVPPQQTAPPPAETFTREEILAFVERARQEEKDKLYPQMEDMSARIKVFEDEAELVRQQEAERLAQEAEADRLRQLEEASVSERWQATEEKWQSQFDEMKNALEMEKALRQKETQYAQLADYKGRRLAEMADQIDPRFHDYIMGNTPEEIEAALYQAAAKTEEIGQEIQELRQTQRREVGMPISGMPEVTPEQLGNVTGRQEYSAADIANMDMASFAQLRPQLLEAGGQAVRDKGLYGAP
jgi:hypothetical protein